MTPERTGSSTERTESAGASGGDCRSQAGERKEQMPRARKSRGKTQRAIRCAIFFKRRQVRLRPASSALCRENRHSVRSDARASSWQLELVLCRRRAMAKGQKSDLHVLEMLSENVRGPGHARDRPWLACRARHEELSPRPGPGGDPKAAFGLGLWPFGSGGERRRRRVGLGEGSPQPSAGRSRAWTGRCRTAKLV